MIYIYNKLTNQKINVIYPLNLNIPDNIIKDVIFISQKHILTDTKNLSNKLFVNSFPEFTVISINNNNFYIEYLSDLIFNDILTQFGGNIDVNDLNNLNINSALLIKFFKIYSKKFTSLTIENLLFLIKYSLFIEIHDFYYFFEPDIIAFFELLHKSYLDLSKYYKNYFALNVIKNNPVVSSIISDNDILYFDGKKPKISIIGSTITLVNNSSHSSNIEQLFYNFELSKTIPFMFYNSGNTIMNIKKNLDVSYLKYHKILNDLDISLLRKWCLQTNKKSLKHTKGIHFKLQVPLKYSSYSNIHYFPNGKIYIRCKWDIQDYANFDNIFICSKNINEFITNINKSTNHKLKIKHIKDKSDYKISNILLYFIVKFPILKDHSKLFLEALHNFKADFKNISFKKLKTYNIHQTNLFFTITLKNNSQIIIKQINTINISFHSFETEITVKDLHSESDINIVQSLIIQIFKFYAFLLKSKLNFDLTHLHIPVDNVKIKNLQILNKQTPIENNIADSKGCQKNRQPIIFDKNKLSATDFKYILNFNNIELVCSSKDYIYPGITVKNIPCCFKKDQRQKKIYLLNTKSSSSNPVNNAPVESIDIYTKQIIHLLNNSNILKLYRILEYKQIGIIPEPINTILSKSPHFFRYGINQSNTENNLIQCVKFLSKSSNSSNTIITNLINSLNEFIFYNLDISKFYSIDDYKNFLLKNKFTFDFNAIKDLLSFYFKANFICFDITVNNASMILLNSQLVYSNTYLLIKNNNLYEPIIYYNNKSNILLLNFSNDFPNLNLLFNKFIPAIQQKVFSPILNPLYILNLNLNFKITGQIINHFNKIIYFIIDNKAIIPVLPSSYFINGIFNKNNTLLINSTKYNNFLSSLNIDFQIGLLRKLITYSTDFNYLSPIAQCVSRDNNKTINALELTNNILLPINPKTSIIKKFPISKKIYTDNIDLVLFKNIKDNNSKVPNNKYYNIYIESLILDEIFYIVAYNIANFINVADNKTFKDNLIDTINILDVKKRTQLLKEFLKQLFHLLFMSTKDNNLIEYLSKNIYYKRPICYNKLLENDCSDDICSTNDTFCKLKIPKKYYDFIFNKLFYNLLYANTKTNNILNNTISSFNANFSSLSKNENFIFFVTNKQIMDYLHTIK